MGAGLFLIVEVGPGGPVTVVLDATVWVLLVDGCRLMGLFGAADDVCMID